MKDVSEILASRTLSMTRRPLPTDAEWTNAQATEHRAQATAPHHRYAARQRIG